MKFNVLLDTCAFCRNRDCKNKEETQRAVEALCHKFPHLSVKCENHVSSLTSWEDNNNMGAEILT